MNDLLVYVDNLMYIYSLFEAGCWMYSHGGIKSLATEVFCTL